MAFILFKKETSNGKVRYINENLGFSLAGWNLVYKVWLDKGKPLNQGWQITADELLMKIDPGRNSQNTALVIDFHPSSRERIGLIEIKNIFCFTFGSIEAEWTPMMLELKDVFFKGEIEDLLPEEKVKIISEFDYKKENEKNFVEFLYLNGDNKSWNWGRNGMTNAAFLFGQAREYFRQYF